MGCPSLGTTSLGQVVLCTYHKNEKYFHGTIQFSPKSMLRMLKNGLGKNHFSPTLTRLCKVAAVTLSGFVSGKQTLGVTLNFDTVVIT